MSSDPKTRQQDIPTQRKFAELISAMSVIADNAADALTLGIVEADNSILAAMTEFVVISQRLQKVAKFATHHIQDLELHHLKAHGTPEEYYTQSERIAKERGSFYDITGCDIDPSELSPEQRLQAYLGELGAQKNNKAMWIEWVHATK